MIDGLMALFVAAVALASLVTRASEVHLTPGGSVQFHVADAVGVMLVLAGTLPLSWRRGYPLPVLAVSGVAFLVYEVAGYAPPALPFAPLIALYTVAAWCPLPASLIASGAMVAGFVLTAVTHNGPLTHDQFLAYVVSAVAASVLGSWVQLRRAYTSLLEEQAMRSAREQAGRTRAAVEQEQARIARELHDIVAHHVCVIVAQAGAAQRVFEAEPQQARGALGSIEATGREALVEMRRLLGVLQTDQGRVERVPQPSLERLPSLVAQVQQAGLPVELSVEGFARPLPVGVELSAYRIVQEALTNTLKHAGAARARVVLDYRGGWLELKVCDDGQGCAAQPAPGQGLVGMQQRADLLGGQLAVRSEPGGGFEVVARLPVDGERP